MITIIKQVIINTTVALMLLLVLLVLLLLIGTSGWQLNSYGRSIFHI